MKGLKGRFIAIGIFSVTVLVGAALRDLTQMKALTDAIETMGTIGLITSCLALFAAL